MNLFKFCLFSILVPFYLIPSIAHSQNIPLSVGVTTNAVQEPSSTIRYEISFSAPCEINIQVIGWESTYNWGTDYDRIYIYNSSNEVIGRNLQSYESDQFLFHMIGDTANLNTRVGMEGTYYLDFHSGNTWGWPDGKTSQSYSILVTAQYVLDTNEINDNLQSAKGISIGQIINAFQWEKVATNSVAGDEDYYRIDVSSPGKLSLEIDNWVGTFNWGADYDRFYLYNIDGEAIGSQSSNDNDPYFRWMLAPEDEIININLATAGTYYLRFHSGAGYSKDGYTMVSSFTPADDEFEPNDDMASAKEVQFDNWYNAYQWRSLDATTHVWGDEDYYILYVPNDGELVITTNNWIGTFNWGADYDRMYIYNSNGEAVGSTSSDPYYDWMMGDGNTTSINLTAGEYYVRLHSGNGYSTDSYSIMFEFNSSATAIDIEKQSNIPLEYALYQNYPNPFNPSTKIKYSVKHEGKVTIKLYDLLGREISVLLDEEKSQGIFELDYFAGDLPSGLYFYSVRINEFYDVKKMILIK